MADALTTKAAAAATASAAALGGRDDLEAALAGVEGLDLPAATRSVGGRMALLERILRKFVEHYGNSAWSLAEPSRADQLPALLRSCHALRGACATIGAVTLATALHDLELAASAPQAKLDELAQAAASIREDLRRLLDGLGRVLRS